MNSPATASPPAESTAEPTNTDRVYQAVTELAALAQGVTPKAVQDLTGMPKGAVDDRLRALADSGRIRRLARGFYGPVETYRPPRLITTTILEDGSVKLEIGETVDLLTPEEFRRLGQLSAGAAIHHAGIQSSSLHQQQAVADLSATVMTLQGQLRDARIEMAQDRDRTQLNLHLPIAP